MLNREDLHHEIRGLVERLEEYDKAIVDGDEAALTALLREGRERKTALDREEAED